MVQPLTHRPQSLTRPRASFAVAGCLAASSLFAGAASPASAQQAPALDLHAADASAALCGQVAPGLLPAPAPPPSAASAGPAATPARQKTTLRPLELAASFDAGAATAPPTIRLGAGQGASFLIPRSLRPTEAMEAELRRKALSSRRSELYANLPDIPELLDNDFIQRERSRVAASVVGSAIETAVSVAFTGTGVRHESAVVVRPEFTTVDRGFKVSTSPTWSYKVRNQRQGLRLDLPLTPSPIRLHGWRDLRGTDHTPMRLGGGVSVDPFDQTVSCGLALEF